MLTDYNLTWQKKSPLLFLLIRADLLTEITKKFTRMLLSSYSDPDTTQIVETHQAIRLEISLEKINDLILHKQICAADVRCLDPGSKQCLMKLCLKNCLAKT